jgi:ferritin-like metal-binding protein YciE
LALSVYDPDTKGNEILDKMISAARDSVSNSNIESSALRDTALIINGNLVEYYEIATYGSLVSLARQLGLQEVGPLEETLKEEKAADAKLTQIAQTSMNAQARQAPNPLDLVTCF